MHRKVFAFSSSKASSWRFALLQWSNKSMCYLEDLVLVLLGTEIQVNYCTYTRLVWAEASNTVVNEKWSCLKSMFRRFSCTQRVKFWRGKLPSLVNQKYRDLLGWFFGHHTVLQYSSCKYFILKWMLVSIAMNLKIYGDWIYAISKVRTSHCENM